jgi:hypothetical protein
LSKASDKMLRAELCVHKKRTLRVFMCQTVLQTDNYW